MESWVELDGITSLQFETEFRKIFLDFVQELRYIYSKHNNYRTEKSKQAESKVNQLFPPTFKPTSPQV